MHYFEEDAVKEKRESGEPKAKAKKAATKAVPKAVPKTEEQPKSAEVEMQDPPRTSGRRYKRMQELYGTVMGKTCKTCKHRVRCGYNRRKWYKCELWIESASRATDIRLRDTACGKYEEKA